MLFRSRSILAHCLHRAHPSRARLRQHPLPLCQPPSPDLLVAALISRANQSPSLLRGLVKARVDLARAPSVCLPESHNRQSPRLLATHRPPDCSPARTFSARSAHVQRTAQVSLASAEARGHKYPAAPPAPTLFSPRSTSTPLNSQRTSTAFLRHSST